ncbi:MAG: radical SAM protein, partial [Anaerolineae bacterium]|nr:radical SAM protein [Anaerolineae bacterium]
MPEDGIITKSHDDILRYEEIIMIAQAAANLGFRKIRLTGGEPLVRLGLVKLITALKGIPGLDDLSMTTNGILLAQHAQALAEAGLDRVNISLDTLKEERFKTITRFGSLHDVLDGIESAHQHHLTPVKINSVIIRGINDDEVVDLARKSLSDGWHLRFIEWMPVGEAAADSNDWESRIVTEDEIHERITSVLGPLGEAPTTLGSGPART